MRSVSLLQRRLEELGITTISICNQPEVSEKVCVPRAIFIQYPYGRMLGDVGDREGQRAVCDDMCAHLEAADGPNAYRHLSHEWPEPPDETQWKPLVHLRPCTCFATTARHPRGWGTIRMRNGPIWTRTTARVAGNPTEEGGFAGCMSLSRS